jgi:hypothetical protein
MPLRLVALAFAFFPALVAGAAIDDDDLNLARSLMRPGYDLAGAQQQLLTGPAYVKDGWHEAKRSNLLIRDLNGDGLKDVFMAVEENPKIQGVNGASCEMPDRNGECAICWGAREIEVHYQQPDGSYRLGARSSRLMMSRDDGGMDPDPFKGFTMTPKGAIRIHFNGGAGWVWAYVYTVQVRKDDLYVIGAYEHSCNGARDDVECYEADVNLVTGQWSKETWIGDGENRKVRKGVMKTLRPCRLRDAFVRMDPCAPPPGPDHDSTRHVLGGPQEGFSCDGSAR